MSRHLSQKSKNRDSQDAGAQGNVPRATAVDVGDISCLESFVPLYSSQKLLSMADISKITFCDKSRSLPALQARLQSAHRLLHEAIDPLVKDMPQVRWKRSVWHRFELPAGIDAPHMMLDGSYYTKAVSDIRELLFKGNVVAGVLEHMDRMVTRTIALEPPIDTDTLLSGSGYGIAEDDRQALSLVVREIIDPIVHFQPLEPSTYELHALRTQVANLGSACSALAWISQVIADKMAKAIGAQLSETAEAHRKAGTSECALQSPHLNAWENHPWSRYLNDVRLQLCASQYALFYLLSFVPFEGGRIPDQMLARLGPTFTEIDGLAKDSVAAQTLMGLNRFLCQQQKDISNWDALPLTPKFLPTRFEANLAYSYLGFNFTRPEVGAYSQLNARFRVPPEKMYSDDARRKWIQISESPNYMAALGQLPANAVASVVAEALEGHPLRITWLGVGSSWLERSAMSTFLKAGLEIPEICVHEINEEDAEKEACRFRSEFPQAHVQHTAGIFSEMDWRSEKEHSGRSLICCLGGTMANVDYRATQRCFGDAMHNGDMLLFDVARASENDPRLRSPALDLDPPELDIERQWMLAGIRQVLPTLDSSEVTLEVRKEERDYGYDFTFIIHEKHGCFEYQLMRTSRYTDDFIQAVASDIGLSPLGQWEYSEILCAYLFMKAR